MGRTITPKYRINLKVEGFAFSPIAWDGARHGAPTDAKLADYVAVLEASTREGGCNAHLGATTVIAATVVRQSDDEVVAEYVDEVEADWRAWAAEERAHESRVS